MPSLLDVNVDQPAEELHEAPPLPERSGDTSSASPPASMLTLDVELTILPYRCTAPMPSISVGDMVDWLFPFYFRMPAATFRPFLTLDGYHMVALFCWMPSQYQSNTPSHVAH